MSTAIQQRVALVVAMLVLAGAAVAFAVDEDEETAALPSPAATATAKARATKPGATPKAQASTAAATAAPASKAPAAPSPTPNLGIARAPKPGTYTYKTKTDGESDEQQLEIADRGTNRQSEEPDGVRADVIWSDESKLIDRLSFGGGFDCDFQPNIAELKFPLRDGASWNQTGKCSSGPVSVSYTGNSRVVGRTKRTVGGVSVDTWRLMTTATIVFKIQGDSFQQKVEEDSYLAPAHGLYVYVTDKSSGTDPQTGEPIRETTVRELVSLSPG